MEGSFLPQLRAQYEALPCGPRDAEEESRRLLPIWLDSLPMINHCCCAGQQDFLHGWRALVAGGGAGDATIRGFLDAIERMLLTRCRV